MDSKLRTSKIMLDKGKTLRYLKFMIKLNKDGKLVEPALRVELVAEIKRLRNLVADIQDLVKNKDVAADVDRLVCLSNAEERRKEPDIFNLNYDL